LESHGHSIVACEGFGFVALHMLCILTRRVYKRKSWIPWAGPCLGTPAALRAAELCLLSTGTLAEASAKGSKKLPFTLKYGLLPRPRVSLVLFSQFELVTICVTF